MQKKWLVTLSILFLFPLNIYANNFQHIRTHGYDYWNLNSDLEQAKWLAKRHDWFIGGGGNITEAVYDAMKSANPNVKIMIYIAYNTYESSVQNWIKDWCQRKGYNFEDTFYHYYYDTEVNLRSTNNPDKIWLKGYGGGTATSLQGSRVPSTWASYSNGINKINGDITRFNINPTSRIWRLGYEAFLLNAITINGPAGKYCDGVFLDTFDGTTNVSFNLQLERTIEMRKLGKYTNAGANIQANNDLVASMIELRTYLTNQVGKPIVILPNAADPDYFYYWNKGLYADRASDYTHIGLEYMVRSGSNTLRSKRLQEVYDTMVNKGIIFFARNETTILNVSEKVNQFLITSHYLINHPNYNLMYHRGSASYYGGNPAGKLYTTHWHKNLEYNIGSPVVRSGSDYWGTANTDRFFTFAKSANYEILGREYTGALVLAKFGAKGGVANAGNNPTSHSLNGNYRLLQADNSLGPVINQITLGDSEGAILIKTQQTTIPVPSPPPSNLIIKPDPSPAPTPTPTPTPVPTPTPTPTPTPGHNTTPAPTPTPIPHLVSSGSTGTVTGGVHKSQTLSAHIYLASSNISDEGLIISNLKAYDIAIAANDANRTLNDTNGTATNLMSTSMGIQMFDATMTPALDLNNQIKGSSRSLWSSVADGKKAGKGGVGEILLNRDNPRKILTNLNSNDLVDKSNYFSASNDKITPELLGFSSEDNAGREKLIQYVQGYDTYANENRGTSLQKRKWILGPILNSRPLAIPYGDSKSMVFIGANDGMLHAFDGKTGEEVWAFIPDELLARLKELPQANDLKYFVDGSPKAFTTPSQKIIVFGLRRGGNYYYSLDVTNPESPKFLWKIGPETTGFSEMGQTWSEPQFGKIKDGKGGKAVFIIGGGYDENQDSKIPGDDKMGRAVYVVDLLTGQQVWRWDYKKDPGMKYSIPSNVARVDVDGDGYLDRLYVGDMGGKLWRFDLKGADPNDWSGRVVFNSNPGYTGSLKQKVFHAPDVTLERGHQIVYFGTGDREHPNEKTGVDKFYAFMDKGSDSVLSEKNLTDVTKDFATVQDLANKEGWYIRLEDKGEKALAPPLVAFGVVYFTTFTPSLDGEGIARIYALNYRVGNPILNLNTENDKGGPRLNLSDRTKIIGTGIPSGTIFSAIGRRPLAYTGFPGGLYRTPLKGHSTVIPISWREVSSKSKKIIGD